MKVLLFYASYGGGHYSAASSIMQYIKKTYPDIEVEICDLIKYISKSIDKITTDAYKRVTRDTPKLWEKFYEVADENFHLDSTYNFSKFYYMPILHLLKKSKPDIVISSHPVGSQIVSYIKKKGKYDCKLASVMTDFASHNQWLIGHDHIDYIFVSNESMREDIISKGVDPDKIYATGIPLSNRFLQHFDREEIKKSFDLDPDKHTILFFGGGEFGLGKDKTLLLLEQFINSLNDTYQMIAIAGKNRKMEKSFRELVRKLDASDKVQVYGFTNEVPELMSISALVVTKPGGLTTTESLASGLPMLIINPIPGQEVQNALFLEEQGVAVWIKNDVDSEIVIKNILNNPEEIKHMKIRAKLLAKKNSTKDICEILFNNYK